MAQLNFQRLSLPGALPSKIVLIACSIGMAVVFIADVLAPADIRQFARNRLKSMQRKPTLITAFWKQAELAF